MVLMSVAGKPGPRRVPVAGVTAGLALVLAVLAVSITLVATRPTGAPAPIRPASPSAGPPRHGPAPGVGAVRPPVSRSKPRARSRPANTVQRPLVRIVERRPPPEPEAPS